MASRNSLTTKGPGMKALLAIAQELKMTPEVRVGIFAASGYRVGEATGITNVQLAFIMEFGSPARGVPQRSFLRRTADAKKDTWLRLMARLLQQVLKKKLKVEQALALVGMQAVADIRATVTRGAGVGPALAEATIKAKGSSRPLVDTSQMINSMGYQVAHHDLVVPPASTPGVPKKPAGHRVASTKTRGGLAAFARKNG